MEMLKSVSLIIGFLALFTSAATMVMCLKTLRRREFKWSLAFLLISVTTLYSAVLMLEWFFKTLAYFN